MAPAPDIAGKGVANPLAAIGCAAMLLEYAAGRRDAGDEYGPGRPASDLRWATLASDIRTPDLGGTARTEDVTRAIITSMTNHA